MLKLYHAPTAVCAAKVRVVLAEKGLDYEGVLVNLHLGDQFKPDYLKLNPNAVVPTLVHDGQVLIESTVINEYLDEAFAPRPLRPEGALGHARVRMWTKREDTIHDTINTMTATMVFRHDLLQKSPQEREARYSKMPDPAKREKWKKMMADGVKAPIVEDALIKLERQFRDMEAALANGPWLAGDAFTLADAGLLSFFYRLEMLNCAGLWDGRHPRVADWYARSKTRDSFQRGIVDFIPDGDHEKWASICAPLWADVKAAQQRALAVI